MREYEKYLNESDKDFIETALDKFKDFDEYLSYYWSKWTKDPAKKKELIKIQTEFRKVQKKLMALKE